ncbi:MAG TPA: KTSC domain-containing protein [Caulobacteraceae bacterium]
MTPLDSSVLKGCEYFPLPMRLVLLFTSGELYEYSEASEELYQGLLAAESKGRFFRENIRGRLPYRRLSRRP